MAAPSHYKILAYIYFLFFLQSTNKLCTKTKIICFQEKAIFMGIKMKYKLYQQYDIESYYTVQLTYRFLYCAHWLKKMISVVVCDLILSSQRFKNDIDIRRRIKNFSG